MAATVASRIAALRKAKGFTFDALAERSSVSKGTLVQIERAQANPSISTLCRLASALGVSVADIVASGDKTDFHVDIITRSGVRRLWTGPNGGYADLLAGTKGPDMLELWQWELKPGERFKASRHSRGTRELIHVTSGTLLLDVSGAETLVAAGATAIARTDQPHAYANPGMTAVRFIMTVHEPPDAL